MKKENMYVPSGLKTRDGKDIMKLYEKGCCKLSLNCRL